MITNELRCQILYATTEHHRYAPCRGQLVDTGRVVRLIARRCRELACIRCGVTRAGEVLPG